MITASNELLREQWLEKKLRRIGSSDARTIFGYGYEDETLLALWERLALGKKKPVDQSKFELFADGHVMEPAIIELFSKKNPEWEVHRGSGFDLVVPEGRDYLCATLDAYGVNKATGEKIVIEAKYEQFGRYEDYEDDQVPMKHYLQVQHQLICTGWRQGVVVSLLKGKFTPRWISRDEELIEQMLIRYDRLIQSAIDGVPPPETGAQQYESVRVQSDQKRAQMFGSKASDAVREVLKAQEQIQAAKKMMDRHMKTIADSAKGCAFVVLDDQQVVKLGKTLTKAIKLPANVRVQI